MCLEFLKLIQQRREDFLLFYFEKLISLFDLLIAYLEVYIAFFSTVGLDEFSISKGRPGCVWFFDEQRTTQTK